MSGTAAIPPSQEDERLGQSGLAIGWERGESVEQEGANRHWTGLDPIVRPSADAKVAVPSPKSLFITNDFPPRVGGAQSYYWGLIQTLNPPDVVVVAPNQPGSMEFDRGHSYQVIRYPREQLGPTRSLLRLALRLADEFKPDIVQFGHALPTGLLGPAIMKRTGVPYPRLPWRG